MKISKFFYILILVLTTSCVETVIVASVGGGVFATREKTVHETRSDLAIAATLTADFLSHGLKMPGNSVNFTVNESRVLLTGIVKDQQRIQKAQDIAWKVSGVKEVINEIQLRDKGLRIRDFTSAFADYLITAEVEYKLLTARDIVWPNYKITTINGSVYLLGVAANDFEMRRTLSVVSRVYGVHKVINHVVLRGDNRRRG